MSRRAKIERKTKESDIVVELDLDGTGVVDVSTGVPFYDHMLTSLGSHASFDLSIKATGDVDIEGHHTIEDTAIVLGQALGQIHICRLAVGGSAPSLHTRLISAAAICPPPARPPTRVHTPRSRPRRPAGRRA